MSYKVKVTQADIDKAVRNNSHHCAVAEAVMRSIPDAELVDVDYQAIRFSRKDTDRRYIYMTPPKPQTYIVDFDAGLPIEPFEFTLSHAAYEGMRRHKKVGHDHIVYHAKLHGESRTGTQNTLLATSRANPPKVRRQTRRYGLKAMRVNQGV